MYGEDQEYDEVYFKDGRNMQGLRNSKKRFNIKEVMKRMEQIEKRQKQAEGDLDSQESETS